MRKRNILIVLGLALCMLTGCQDQTEYKEPAVEEEPVVPLTMTEKERPARLEGLVREQTFDVTLDGWGEVTFATFIPKGFEQDERDVVFKLLKNGQPFYDFPAWKSSDENRTFSQVAAVAFRDYNDDGREDVIVLSEYLLENGETENDVKIFNQQEGRKDFEIDERVTAFLMENGYSDSITTVMAAKADYEAYIYSLLRGEIVGAEAQLQIMAERAGAWLDPSMVLSKEPYRMAVADLDNNGRLELIVSRMGGSGVYTTSHCYEINETLDGLTECSLNLEEGQSEPDILSAATDVYRSEEGEFYYIFHDYSRVDEKYYDTIVALSLSEGMITTKPLAVQSEDYESEEKLLYHDMEGNLLKEKEYLRIADEVFEDCIRAEAYFGWQDLRGLENPETEVLLKLLQTSWAGFDRR